MKKSLLAFSCLLATATMISGCSSAGTVGSMGLNLMRKDSYLKVWLDGQEAKQNKLKKAWGGHSSWDVKEPIENTPTLKFEIESPEKFGRITKVVVSIYQEFEADYSHQAEFTIVAADTNDPQAQMKPGVEYDLSNPGEGFKVLDLTGNEIEGVELKYGLKYAVGLTVVADRSESIMIFCETK